MKFKYVGESVYDDKMNEITVNGYGDTQVKAGDTVELNDYFSSKATTNPNYEEIKTRKKAKKADAVEINPEEVKAEEITD